jgi:hypothetical protein
MVSRISKSADYPPELEMGLNMSYPTAWRSVGTLEKTRALSSKSGAVVAAPGRISYEDFMRIAKSDRRLKHGIVPLADGRPPIPASVRLAGGVARRAFRFYDALKVVDAIAGFAYEIDYKQDPSFTAPGGYEVIPGPDQDCGRPEHFWNSFNHASNCIQGFALDSLSRVGSQPGGLDDFQNPDVFGTWKLHRSASGEATGAFPAKNYRKISGATSFGLPKTQWPTLPRVLPAQLPGALVQADPMVIWPGSPAPMPGAVPIALLPSLRPNPLLVEQSVRGPAAVPQRPPGRVGVSAFLPTAPGPRTRERKFTVMGGIRRAFPMAIAALEGSTEVLDLLDAAHKALPPKFRARGWFNPKTGKGGQASPQKKAKALFKHYQEVDVNEFVRNVVKNELSDQMHGRLAHGSKVQAQRSGSVASAESGHVLDGGHRSAEKWFDQIFDHYFPSAFPK